MTERLSLGFWLRTALVIGGLNLQAKSYLHIIIYLKPGWNYKGWRKKSRGCTRNWRSWASEGEGVRKRKILCEVSTCLEIKAHSREDPPLISDCSFHWKTLTATVWFYVLYFPNAFMNVITRLLVVKWKTLRFSGKKSQIDWGNDLCRKNEKKKCHGKLLRIRFSLLTTGCKRHDQFYALVQRVLCIIF